MVLKSLEIHGFKSFPDKTVLSFGKGITAVVGPNGSGKSNISDAIRWVLGEQSTKSLRGSKMEDVIFSGTAQRKGVGFAEVSLIIDNSEHKLDFDADDVKITRRYYRSGDSEYLINNATVRLKDVQLLFMDTGLGRDGYSIIGQGSIGDIVASKSQERREIFEEAAGISKYRYRKNEAERRLKSTEENLLRLRDILQELEERVGPLKIQSEKAKKFLEYSSEKKELEIGLWLHSLEQSRISLRELHAKLELARTQYDEAGEAIEGIESQIETISQQSQLLAVQTEEIRVKIHQAEEQAAQCESEKAVLHNDIFHNEENIQRIQNELQDSETGGKQTETEIASRREEIVRQTEVVLQNENKQAALYEQLDNLAKSSSEFSGKMEELSSKASSLAMQLSEYRVQKVTAESSLTEINAQLSQLQASIDIRSEQNRQTEREAAECQEAFRVISERIEELQNALKGYEYRYQSRVRKLEECKNNADQLNLDAQEKHRRARILEDLERNLEGFSQSVKVLMKQAERRMLNGIHGPVSMLINAAPAYALAVETALGAATQNIVCDTEDDAKRGIHFLKESNSGRATFLPISTIKANVLNESGLEQENGFVGMASDLVTYQPRYEQIAKNLLGRTVVAEDMDYAVVIARKHQYRFRVVTLDGQVINAGGSMTGGSHVKNAGLLSRRSEIEKIKSEAEALDKKAELARDAYKAAQQETASTQAEMLGTQGELTTAQEDRIRCESELRRLKDQVEQNAHAVTMANSEIEKLQHRVRDFHEAIQRADEQTKLLTAEKEDTDLQLSKASGGQSELSRQREQLSSELSDIKLTILAHNKEIEAKEAAIVDLQNRMQNAAGYRLQLTEQIKQLEDQNVALRLRIQQMEEQAAALKEEAHQFASGIEELLSQRTAGEAEQTRLRQSARSKSEEREQSGREVARIEEKCAVANKDADELTKRLYEEYELTRMEAEAIAKPLENVSTASRRLNELKNKIRGLGSVNVDAIEEYKEVSERYEFLSVQVKDVEDSKGELMRLINELTLQMREIFIERFNQINYHYGIVFQELFGGGRGELKLSDPGDILHSGIEMFVQPPGKVILNLDSLSGGEKALVAIALLFAILKVTPSPFCVLDEIEAALDDVNVDRYAAYLRRMCDETQFIVITHRRGTMEESDVLYGVTMQESGVSKLLELRASEVEAKLGISGGKD